MSHTVFRFRDYLIDPATRELWQGAQRVALPPKSFDCLAYLLEQRERAVGRDELISAVWGRVDVSDAVLAQTLLRARRSVGDTGSEQTTIRTVPRFGYRWIAPVQQADRGDTDAVAQADAAGPEGAHDAARSGVDMDADAPVLAAAQLAAGDMAAAPAARAPGSADAASTPVAIATATVQRQAPSRRVAWAMLAVAASIALGYGLWRLRADSPAPASAARGDVAVAVLPVVVSGADAEGAWIRLGGMDYVAARLHEEGELSVLPSGQIVALVGDLGAEAALERVAKTGSTKWLVQPYASRSAKGWEVKLVARGGDAVHEASAFAATPLDAAGQASERLLGELGVAHAARVDKPWSGALTELLQRFDAALLAGDMGEARRLIDAAPAAQRSEPALRVREGQLEFRQGHVDQAEALFKPIAGSATPLPAEVQTQAMMGLGAVAVRRGDFPLAEKHYAEALAALGDHGDANLVGNAYNGRGVARAAQGHYDLALADLGRARVSLERAGNHLDAANVDGNLATAESSRKRYAQAISHYDSAIAVHERFGVDDNLGSDLQGKANAQLQLLDVQGALASSQRGHELSAHLENHILVRSIGVRHAAVLLALGRLKDTQAVLDNLPRGANAEPSNDMRLLGAQLALAAGDAGKALDLALPPVQKEPESHYGLLAEVVEAALRQDKADLARQLLARTHAEPTEADDRMLLALARGRLAAAGGDAAQADTQLAAALALADQGGAPADRARMGSAYARFLIDQRQLDKASAVVGDLAPYADRDFAVAQVMVALYHALGDTALEEAARARARPVTGERRL